MSRLLLQVALVAPLFLLVGCTPTPPTAPKVSARGKIVVKGQPWKMKAEENTAIPKGTKAPPGAPPGAGGPGGGGGVQITFSPVGSFPGADAVIGKIDPNSGTFDIPSISPGKYKISLGIAGQMGGDPFEGKFTPNVSKIERDVDGKAEIVIDISKPTG